MPEPKKSVIVLKKFLKKFRPDLDSTVDLNNRDFLVIGCTATLTSKLLKTYGKDTLQLNSAEFYVCEMFVVTAARLMLHNFNNHKANNTVLLAYCSTFVNRFGKEEVIQRGYDAVAPFNHFYENYPNFYHKIEFTMARYLEQPSYKQMRVLSDLFKRIIDNTIKVERRDDDVIH